MTIEQHGNRFSQTVSLVAGGTGGLGRAVSLEFLTEGAVVVTTYRTQAEFDELLQAAGANAARLEGHRVDVTDEAATRRLTEEIVGRHGHLDALVNTVGGYAGGVKLHELDTKVLDQMLALNLRSGYALARAVLPAMLSKGRGSIVNMSSVNAVLTIPTIASYNVSKGGINQLTRVMALALADKGIRVNAVAPGTIATELAAKAVLTSEEAKQKIMMRSPMKRLGEPSEVADVVAWLASDAASYVTGEIVVVDGGRMTLNYTVPV